MHVDVKIEYVLVFEPNEFNLVSRALRGVLNPEEIEPAKQLQRQMMEQKVKASKSHFQGISKLEKNLTESDLTT